MESAVCGLFKLGARSAESVKEKKAGVVLKMSLTSGPTSVR